MKYYNSYLKLKLKKVTKMNKTILIILILILFHLIFQFNNFFILLEYYICYKNFNDDNF